MTTLRSTASVISKLSATLSLPYTTAATTTAAASLPKLQESQTRNGKWLTLPPFTSTINPNSVANHLSKTTAATSTTTNTTTALKWILRCCPHLSHSLVQKLFRLKQVRRESNSESLTEDQPLKKVSAKDELKLGDRIFLPLSVKGGARERENVRSEKVECRCSEEEVEYIQSLELYKDEAIIVINKPPGMPVQGGIGIRNSLDVLAASSLKYDYPESPRLVHRLDRDSSGILVLGRTQTSAAILHSIFREKTCEASNDDGDSTKRILQRTYWALVIGTPRCTRGSISAPLGKVVLDNGKSERITIVDDSESMPSQHAVTEYRVVDSSPHGYTWLELCPLTGRKHQLRVHCAEVLGTPIVGDYKYGWQAHRNWNPVAPCSNHENTQKFSRLKMLPFGLNLEGGSILDKRPHLHLHCKRMVLPDVSLALQHMQSTTDHDLSQLKSLDLVAPLPLHMQRSWDYLSS